MTRYTGHTILRDQNGDWYIRLHGDDNDTPAYDMGIRYFSREEADREAPRFYETSSYYQSPAPTRRGDGFFSKLARLANPIEVKSFDQKWAEGVAKFRKVK
jgi:hypothetical protein